MKLYFKHYFDIKVKVWYPFVAMVLYGSVLTACVFTDDNPIDPNPGQEATTGDDSSDNTPYKTMPVIVNDNGKSTKMVALRYYDDMPHVAYIAVSDFQNMRMPNKSIKVSRTAASQYLLVPLACRSAFPKDKSIGQTLSFAQYFFIRILSDTL